MKTIRLWDGPAPEARGEAEQDVPTLTFYPAAAGASPAPAVIVFPGGCYEFLADHEGAGYAEWLAAHGFAAFVLRYRLGSAGYRHPVPLLDARRAVRLVRARAKEFSVDPRKIAVMGSSAGGHLAALLATEFDGGLADAADMTDRFSSRPDAAVLCYPVIMMYGPYMNERSRDMLCGTDTDRCDIKKVSPHKRVRPDTPPCFLWHCRDDQPVPEQNSRLFAAALQAKGIPHEFHLYETGGHGMGLGNGHPWTAKCLEWLGKNLSFRDSVSQ